MKITHVFRKRSVVGFEGKWITKCWITLDRHTKPATMHKATCVHCITNIAIDAQARAGKALTLVNRMNARIAKLEAEQGG